MFRVPAAARALCRSRAHVSSKGTVLGLESSGSPRRRFPQAVALVPQSRARAGSSGLLLRLPSLTLPCTQHPEAGLHRLNSRRFSGVQRESMELSSQSVSGAR